MKCADLPIGVNALFFSYLIGAMGGGVRVKSLRYAPLPLTRTSILNYDNNQKEEGGMQKKPTNNSKDENEAYPWVE